jgi:DNA (cytosine-5)-methyltransferase 1
MNTLKVLDLFSGIGGFSLGLERAGGFETSAFCEINKNAQKVLKKHWPNVPIFEDVTTLKGEQLGTIDVICGGFPCQDISLAGKGAGLEGARSGLWFEFHRLIKEIKPSWVIAENVAVLRSRGLDQVLRSLAEIGYDAEWHCIPASAVGAPHQRDRVWIVAYPQLHGRAAPEIAGSIEETIRRQSQRSDNAFDVAGASSVPAPSADVANTNIVETQVQTERQHASQQVLRGTSEAWRTTVGGFWGVEPNVGRVADGVSGRVDRLKQLGNAVVPQIPELIGRAINAIA